MVMPVSVKKLVPEAQLPTYATPGAAAFDIRTNESGFVEPCGSRVFGTGLAFEVPEEHVMLLFSRSGHGFNKGIRLANCVGVIDSDYRGELKVKLQSDDSYWLEVNEGERIAQGIILKYDRIEFVEEQDLRASVRGEGGFGSTGVA